MEILDKYNELEHSTYVRSLIRQGVFDFSNVIYKKQYWSPMFDMCCIGQTRPFWLKWYSTSPITYCPDCIRQSILDFGYGYFKSIWWRSYWCRVHKKKLKVLKPLDNQRISDLIMDVLSGRKIHSSDDISSAYFPRPIRKSLHLRLDTPDGFQWFDVDGDYRRRIPDIVLRRRLFKFSPCFQEEFLLWVQNNHYELLNLLQLDDENYEFFEAFYNKKAILYRCSPKGLNTYAQLFFNLFCQENIQLFKMFIEGSALYLDKENLLKKKSIACSFCPRMDWSNHCPVSQDILRLRLTPPVLRRRNVEQTNQWNQKLGEPLVKEVDEELINLGKFSNIDSIHYMATGSFVCSELAVERLLYCDSYVLLGWGGTDNSRSNETDYSLVSLPLYSDVEVVGAVIDYTE